MTLCQKLYRYKRALQGRAESMQQPSATPKNQDVGIGLQNEDCCMLQSQSLHLGFLGVVEDCCMLSTLPVVSFCIYSFSIVSSLHPTAFLMVLCLQAFHYYVWHVRAIPT